MSASKDLTGQKFGLLVVLARAGSSPSGNALWRCVCSCPARTEDARKRPGKGVHPVGMPCAGGCPDADGNRAPQCGADAKAIRSRKVLIAWRERKR